MKNALIYSPGFSGHRQVYVFVIAHILDKLNYGIWVAGNLSDENLNNTFYIDKLRKNKNIHFVNTNVYPENGMSITNAEFRLLQMEHNIDVTVFAEADNHIDLLNSQLLSKNKKFQGKKIGIFLRPFYFYRKLKFREKIRYYRHLYARWKDDVRLFHEVLNRSSLLLNKSLYIDDYFASKHKHTICLPDVFQQYADKLLQEQHSDQRVWMQKLDNFVDLNNGRQLILYFGTAQKRRGYDQLLDLSLNRNACFIHCGLRRDVEDYDYNVDHLRQKLEKANRLFETNEYLTDPLCIEHFFNSVTHLILPYVEFYGSSGVMLQALGYKIPVLVPDVGIMGYRVKKFNLGQTYSHSLEEAILPFLNTPKEKYADSIENYMKSQSSDKLEALLMKTFSEI